MKGTKCRVKQRPIIFRSFYLHFDQKKKATWKLCISVPSPFSAMEKNGANPHFPARGSAEPPVQSKWEARARNTHAGRELRGRLYSKLLQQLNLNIKLISLRGLITALIAAQVITEWDITPVISIYYRIDIRYYCICHYLYQSMPVSGDEWDASNKRSWAGVTPTAPRGNACVCLGSAFGGILLGVDHELPAPLCPCSRSRGATCHPRAGGHREVPPHQGDVRNSTCTEAKNHKPRSHQTFPTQPRGWQRTTRMERETLCSQRSCFLC